MNATMDERTYASSLSPNKKIHEVKSWLHFYKAIMAGTKTHDLRKDDRGYNVGDYLHYKEYDFIGGRFTGNSCFAEITYMTDSRTPCAFSSVVLSEGYCILSIRTVKG